TAKPTRLAQLPLGEGVSHQALTWQADSKRIKVEGENPKNGKNEAYLVSINRPGALTRTSPTPDNAWKNLESIYSPNRRYRCAFLGGSSGNRILVVKDVRTGKEIRRFDT